MTFGEFVETINEVYHGNERDLGSRPMMVSEGGEACYLDQIDFGDGKVVMRGVSKYVNNYLARILEQLVIMNRLKEFELKGNEAGKRGNLYALKRIMEGK